MKLDEQIRECCANLIAEGRFDVADVVKCVRKGHAAIVRSEARRLIDQSIETAAKRYIRGFTSDPEADEDEEQTALPGFGLPRAIAVPKPSGLYYYVPVAQATWKELIAGRDLRAQHLATADRALATYNRELERVRPLMEADEGLTYGEAVVKLEADAA